MKLLTWLTSFAPWVGLSGILSAADFPVRAPEGFQVEKVAGSPAVVFPMFAAFDNHGRLYVAESSGLDLYAELQKQTRNCRIRRLEDRDGDGHYDHSQIFADRLVFPMGLVWRQEQLYVADPPDLVALEDRDGDGRAEQRRVVLSGFGHKDNGSLHGLTFGPDGFLYFTMGSPDGYKLKRDDGSWITGSSGALIRCRATGSQVEVLARGFENLVEIAFLPTGEIIGTDNWFYLPEGGVRDALVHLVEGGLYPLKLIDEGTPQFVSGVPLPSVADFPAVALSGLLQYRSQAFPETMRGNLFSALHNSRKIARHQLVREGASYRALNFDFLTTEDPDFHPSDVVEDADGSLLVVDTGSWYVHHCPTGRIRNSPAQGGIYRVRFGKAGAVTDPWGLKVDWARLDSQALAPFLSDPRPFVRDRAGRELIGRNRASIGPLTELLSKTAPRIAKEAAIWVLAGIPEESALAPIRDLLSVTDKSLVALSARALALRNDRSVAGRLEELLQQADLTVRMAAAEALAHCGRANSLPTILSTLAEVDDRFLEHALVNALHRLADTPSLTAALEHPHPRVRKAAMYVLDQPPRRQLTPEIALKFTSEANDELRRGAHAILGRHPEWAQHALKMLQQRLAEPDLSPDQLNGLRELLLAFQRHAEVADLVATALTSNPGAASEKRSVWMLETMRQFGLSKVPPKWYSALRNLFVHPDPQIRTEVVQTISAFHLNEFKSDLARLTLQEDELPSLRIIALRNVIEWKPELEPREFQLLTRQLERANPPLARLAAAEIVASSRPDTAQFVRLIAQLRGDPLVSPSVLISVAQRTNLSADAADLFLGYLAASLAQGWSLSEAQLNWVVTSTPDAWRPQTEALFRQVQQAATQQNRRLEDLEPLLHGGDPEHGRQLFFDRAACSACHQVAQSGGRVGPDLTKIGAIRSGRDLLESVVFPGATFAQGYESFAVTTRSGEILHGRRSRESTELVELMEASGAIRRIPKEEVVQLERSMVSMMPEGLLLALNREEIRDLFAYLQQLR